METIYLLDTASTALILIHSFTGRPPPTAILEYFQSLLLEDPLTTPPSILPIPANIVNTPTVLFHVRSSNKSITLLTPITHEPHDALGVIELLTRIIEVLEDYFGREKLGRGIIEGNFDIVEELLGEIVDAGQIMTTEPNALRDIVLPPSLLNKFMSAAGLQGYTSFISMLIKIVRSCRDTILNTLAKNVRKTQRPRILCRHNRIPPRNPLHVTPTPRPV